MARKGPRHPDQYLVNNGDNKVPMEGNNAPLMEDKIPRPNYIDLKRFYHHVEVEIINHRQKPIPEEHKDTFVDAKIDFEDALFELLPQSGMGKVILDPADTKTEQARVTNAAIALHDWLRLYEEDLKQSPPQGLQDIAQVLNARRDDLNRVYPPAAYQPD